MIGRLTLTLFRAVLISLLALCYSGLISFGVVAGFLLRVML